LTDNQQHGRVKVREVREEENAPHRYSSFGRVVTMAPGELAGHSNGAKDDCDLVLKRKGLLLLLMW
jgi:hypothetical protein